jgi:glycosyltransferase involved in cell wall biosynthesis
LSVIISCSGKFHAFALAEQMQKHGMLDSLFTTYAYQKNTMLRHFVKRIDKEDIPCKKIHTNNLLAFPLKLLPGQGYRWLDLYDHWVASKINNINSKIFIGWSGMSLHAIKVAKASGNLTIIERGSSHILYQNQILMEEYKKFGITFSIDKRIVEKELKEYEVADYISVPSSFVRNSFIAKGIPEAKIFMNPYGVGSFFKPSAEFKANKKIKILYLGSLSIRKGLVYLFEALNSLAIEENSYEVWFIGKIDKDLDESIKLSKKGNWKFFGHIDHYDLHKYLVQCDFAVHPSVEEGLSMVILQLMSCGVPVIATTNTGGENVITDGLNGYIVPIRAPLSIAEKISYLIANPPLLNAMKKEAIKAIEKGFTWNDYGKRYVDFLNTIKKP